MKLLKDKKYKTIDSIYYGENKFYDADTLGQMHLDGFILNDYDEVVLPANTIIKSMGMDKYGNDILLIGNNEYDFFFDDLRYEDYFEEFD